MLTVWCLTHGRCSTNDVPSPVLPLPCYSHQSVSWSKFRESQWCDLDKKYWRWNLKGKLRLSLLIPTPTTSLGLRNTSELDPASPWENRGQDDWVLALDLRALFLGLSFLVCEMRREVNNPVNVYQASNVFQAPNTGWVRKERLKGWMDMKMCETWPLPYRDVKPGGRSQETHERAVTAGA